MYLTLFQASARGQNGQPSVQKHTYRHVRTRNVNVAHRANMNDSAKLSVHVHILYMQLTNAALVPRILRYVYIEVNRLGTAAWEAS